LFYYWQPAGLMAKYKFAKIEQDPFNQACWDTIVSGEGKLCSSDFLVARLSVAVSSVFAQRNPELVAFFERVQFEPPLLNQMILEMTESRANGEKMAAKFLREHTDIWHAWLPADAAARADHALGLAQSSAPESTGSTSVDAQPASADTPDGQVEAQDSASGAPSPKPAATDSDAGTASLGAALTGQGIFPDWSAAEFVNQRLLAMVKSYGSSFRESSEFILTTVLLPIERLME